MTIAPGSRLVGRVRGARETGAPLGLALLLFVGLVAGAAAQTSDAAPPSTALLQVGPEQRRGIDALAPDLTLHWYGRYRVSGATVDVVYARVPLAAPAAWPLAPCPTRTLRAGGGSYYYEAPEGWSLLVDTVAGDLPPGVTICLFVDRFILQHLLFENLEGVRPPGRAPIFPAVIEL